MPKKDFRKLEKAAIDSLAFEKSKAIVFDLQDLLLDDDLKDEIIDQLPIIKYRSIYTSIRDAFFFNKFIKFIDSINSVPACDRQRFLQNLTDGVKADYGRYLVNYIDRLDDERKPDMAGDIFIEYVKGNITKNEMLRFNHILEKLFILDIEELKVCFETNLAINNDLASRLAPFGITTYEVSEDPRIDEFMSNIAGGRPARPPIRPFQKGIFSAVTELGKKFFIVAFNLNTNDS